MFNIYNNGQIEKVIFIIHRNTPPKKISLRPYYPENRLPFREYPLELVREIGNLRIYALNVKISRLVPAVFNPDYEKNLDLTSTQSVKIESVMNPKVIGKVSLAAINNTGKDILITSKKTKTFDINTNNAFLLFVYARKYGQASRAMLIDYNKMGWPPASGILNPYIGEIRLSNSPFSWQMLYIITPVTKGRYNFQEVIHLQDESSFIDGFQSFLLYKQNNSE